MSPATTRRERVRAATTDEIKQTARALLVSDGPTGISLRAIGREMGMTAAALYRYFPSLEALVEALCADLYDEVRTVMEHERDRVPADDPGTRLMIAARTFRRWSIDHPAEFGIMFGNPIPDVGPPPTSPEHADSPAHRAAMRFAATFAGLFADIWRVKPFPVPAPEEMPPGLRDQLHLPDEWAADLLPPGAVQLFLSCWIRLYGMVALEVYGHLHFAMGDAEPMFEAELATAARQLGIPAS